MKRYLIVGFFIFYMLPGIMLADENKSPGIKSKDIVKLLENGEKKLEENPDQALVIASQILLILENQKTGNDYIQAIHLRASANSNLENHGKALKDFELCREHSFFVNDTTKLGELTFNIARCYDCLADYNTALSTYRDALKLYQVKKNIYGQAKVLQNIGIIESDRRRDSLAMVYYHKALDLYQILGNKSKQAAVLQNIGVVYSNQENFIKTIEYYKIALKIFVSINNLEGIASIENNLGLAYERELKFNEALDHYRKSLSTFKKLKSRTGLAYVHDNMASLYRRQKKYDTALLNYKIGLKYADSVQIPDFKAYVYKEMASLYEEMGNYEQSLHYYKTGTELENSIYNNETRKKLSEAEAVFQGELKDVEIQKKEFQLNVQKKKKTFYLAGIILLLLMLLGLIWAYRKKTMAESQLREHQDMLEEEVQQRTNELKLEIFERKAAEEADKLKTAFLANMSHEIRTPMNAILAFSNFLKDPEISGAQRNEYVNYINSCSISLLHLIDDILDTAKIEAKQLKINYSQCYINATLSELYVYFLNHKKCKEGDIILHVKTACIEKNYSIVSDVVRIRQILTNLLDNAFKFTQKGHISFGFNVENDFLHFYVRDTGSGIPSDKTELIFERFGQAHDTTHKVTKGTGLGLSISKNLVELLGGTMWVETVEGEGTCFYFTTPARDLKISELLSDDNPVLHNSIVNHTHWKNFNVLVAEDDDLNYKLIQIALKKTQANIVRAVNGEEVLKIVKEKPNIHAVLMDIQMPLLDGYETTKRLKEHFPHIYVIAQTAFAMSEDKNKCIEAGCDDYISKPIDMNELLSKLCYSYEKTEIKHFS